MSPEKAVAILMSDKPPKFMYEREFAVMAFSGWLNSPEEPEASGIATFILLSRIMDDYLSKGLEIDPDLIVSVYNPKTFLETIESRGVFIPTFWEAEQHEFYNNPRYVADIVRFLLTYKPKFKDKRLRASLGRAYEFINQYDGFDSLTLPEYIGYWCSQTQHQVIWKDFKKSSCFQFVRFYNPEIDWLIDPRKKDLFATVSTLSANRKSVSEYFSKVFWVQEQLKSIIDRRSMREEDFFAFPASVTPMECKLPKIPARAYKVLKNYRRNRAE